MTDIANIATSSTTATSTAAVADTTATPPTAPKRRRRGIRGRKGVVDNHPDMARIERDLALGVPLDRIAKKYGISRDSAWRHKAKIPPQLKAALAGDALKPGEDLDKIRVTESEGLLANLAAQRARLLRAQDMAFETEQLGLVAQLGAQVHTNLRLVGGYLGEFAQHHVTTSVSILISEEYLEFRSRLLRSLGAFPDARRVVAAELHRTEAVAATQRPAPTVIEHESEPAHAGAA